MQTVFLFNSGLRKLLQPDKNIPIREINPKQKLWDRGGDAVCQEIASPK